MSLISDPEYVHLPSTGVPFAHTPPPTTSFLLHRVRLAYLRVVDDPYAARVTTFTPDYALNPHILAAGLADPERWPELAQPHSPPPSPPPSPTFNSQNGKLQSDRDNDASPGRHRPRREPRRHSGFPGATGLKYSETIVGPTRTGVMGIGVSRKRTSTARPRISSLSGSVKIDVQPASPTGSGLNGESGSATPNASGSAAVRGRMRADSEPTPGGAGVSDELFEEKGRKRRSSEAEALATAGASPKTSATYASPSAPASPMAGSAVQTPTAATATPKPTPPPFIPKFKIDPRMEARRKMRMNARAQAQAAHNQASAVTTANTNNLRSSLSSFTAPHAPQQKTVTIINPDTSSDEEEEREDNRIDEESESSGLSESDDDSDSLRVTGDPDDEADDFNPYVALTLLIFPLLKEFIFFSHSSGILLPHEQLSRLIPLPKSHPSKYRCRPPQHPTPPSLHLLRRLNSTITIMVQITAIIFKSHTAVDNAAGSAPSQRLASQRQIWNSTWSLGQRPHRIQAATSTGLETAPAQQRARRSLHAQPPDHLLLSPSPCPPHRPNLPLNPSSPGDQFLRAHSQHPYGPRS